MDIRYTSRLFIILMAISLVVDFCNGMTVSLDPNVTENIEEEQITASSPGKNTPVVDPPHKKDTMFSTDESDNSNTLHEATSHEEPELDSETTSTTLKEETPSEETKMDVTETVPVESSKDDDKEETRGIPAPSSSSKPPEPSPQPSEKPTHASPNTESSGTTIRNSFLTLFTVLTSSFLLRM